MNEFQADVSLRSLAVGCGTDRPASSALATQRRPPYIPADPQDIMAALLKTPPPAGDKSTRQAVAPQFDSATWDRT
jgi:hypothetical protein